MILTLAILYELDFTFYTTSVLTLLSPVQLSLKIEHQLCIYSKKAMTLMPHVEIVHVHVCLICDLSQSSSVFYNGGLIYSIFTSRCQACGNTEFHPQLISNI